MFLVLEYDIADSEYWFKYLYKQLGFIHIYKIQKKKSIFFKTGVKTPVNPHGGYSPVNPPLAQPFPKVNLAQPFPKVNLAQPFSKVNLAQPFPKVD